MVNCPKPSSAAAEPAAQPWRARAMAGALGRVIPRNSEVAHRATRRAGKPPVVVTTSDTYDRRIDGIDVVVGSAQWNDIYTEHLTWLSRTAAGAGSRLVLVTPVPRSSRFYVEADNESGWREQAVVDAMRNFAAGNSRTVVLDLWAVLCPTGDCDQLVEGFDPAWRYDGLHFDAFGARWFADWITPSLVTLETGLPPR